MGNPFAPDNEKTLTQAEARRIADITHDVPFHTIGKGPTQAASGSHKHTDYVKPSDLIAGNGISIAVDSVTGSITISVVAEVK